MKVSTLSPLSPLSPLSSSQRRRNWNYNWTTMTMLATMLLVATTITTTTTTQAFTIASTSQRDLLAAGHPRITTTSLFVAKTGGKEIVTDQQFEDLVLSKNGEKPVLVFFTAPWCGPCRLSTPVVKEVMKQFSKDIEVVELCTDELAEISASCGVTSIPTIQFYFGGQLLDTIVGCVAKSVLANAVTKILEDVGADSSAVLAKK